jgi:hypothetical protein
MKNERNTTSKNKNPVKTAKTKTQIPQKSLLPKTIKKNSKAKTGIKGSASLRNISEIPQHD